MFGYVKPVPEELLVREHAFYRALYCGVCRAMQKHTGRLSALALSYDSVFYALVRLLLADETVALTKCRCIAHPCRARQCAVEKPALVDTARAFAVLAYGKVQDEYADRRGLARIPLFFAKRALARAARRAALPALQAAMQRELDELARLERECCPSVDRVADCTGRMISHFFREGLDGEAAEIAGQIGFCLGRFIASLDAAEDYERDKRKGNYNPYRYRGDGSFGEAERESACVALRAELCELESAMNRLPLDRRPDAGDILKNILYLGLPSYVDRLAGSVQKEGAPS